MRWRLVLRAFLQKVRFFPFAILQPLAFEHLARVSLRHLESAMRRR